MGVKNLCNSIMSNDKPVVNRDRGERLPDSFRSLNYE